MSGVSPIPSSQRTLARQPYLPPLAILAVLALIATFTFLGPVIKPVLVAVFLFFIIQPAAKWLTDRGLSSWLSYVLLLFLVMLMGMVIVRVAYRNLSDLQLRIPQYEERAIDLLSHIPGIDAEQFKRPRVVPSTSELTPEMLFQSPPATADHLEPPSAEAVSVTPLPVTPQEAIPTPATPSVALPLTDDTSQETAASTIPPPLPSDPEQPAPPLDEGTEALEGDSTTSETATSLAQPSIEPRHETEIVSEPTPTGSILRQALPPPPPPPAEQLEGKTILEIFNITSEAIGRILLGTAVEWLEGGLMVLFYLIFVILDAHRLPNRIRRALPETGEKVVEMGQDINESITNYMRVKTLVSLGMAVTAALLMALFRLENWPLWALITFLFNYVTYVGSLGALLPPIAIAFLQFENPAAAIILAVLLSGNRFFWIDYVEIRFAGRRLSINAVLLLLSLAYWGKFWGITGLVLAVPMLTAAKIALEKFPSTRNWAVLISED